MTLAYLKISLKSSKTQGIHGVQLCKIMYEYFEKEKSNQFEM